MIASAFLLPAIFLQKPSPRVPILQDLDFNTNKKLDRLLDIGKFSLLQLAPSSSCPYLVDILHLLDPLMDYLSAY